MLDWNQIFIDTLIATNTANSSSPRLGAIVHTAIFDSYNGIEQRYTPIFVHNRAPDGASRRAAIIAAAYTALVGLFASQQPALDARYAASLARSDGNNARVWGGMHYPSTVDISDALGEAIARYVSHSMKLVRRGNDDDRR